jgi:hypothetical protein
VLAFRTCFSLTSRCENYIIQYDTIELLIYMLKLSYLGPGPLLTPDLKDCSPIGAFVGISVVKRTTFLPKWVSTVFGASSNTPHRSLRSYIHFNLECTHILYC